MSRTIAPDHDEKSRLILNTAAEVFAEKGYDAATTKQIAKKCGMSKSVLYHYHRSKMAILYALLTSHLHEVLCEVQQAVDAYDDAEERFRAFLKALLRNNAVSRSKNIVLLNSTGVLPAKKRGEVIRLERKLVEVGSDLLRKMNDRVMKPKKLRMPYTMFLFGLVNWTYTWYEPKGPLTPDEVASRIADLFLKGFLNIGKS